MTSRQLLIVGIGASAGGLEAFTELLQHLPADTGMGFVLVQHLDPAHESALTQLLSRATSMPVHEVTHNLAVKANHVYVIPPNTQLSISRGVLKLRPRQDTAGAQRAIDFFLESLAQDQSERAIGVILSGTATDGTLGMEAIKAEGGITFAQDESAKYDSMPRSATGAGCVDFVLRPEDIAKELARIAKHPYLAGPPSPASSAKEEQRGTDGPHKPEQPPPPGGGTGNGPRISRMRRPAGIRESRSIPAPPESQGFQNVLHLLYQHSGVDFSLYKTSTILRRITRRMVLNKQESLEQYARFLRRNTQELDALYSDVLISVTSFFRNAETFEALKQKVFPKLLERRSEDPCRVWVLGCSTGQEAYSIAMAFVEAAEKASSRRTLQVFATDLNENLLNKARHGLYAKNLLQDLSADRLKRFFTEEEGGYRICKPLREMVVFARQNLINDPPFSRMDLISCRNLLIYLEPPLQKKIMPMFHYALNPGGFLLLGASESIGGFTDLFEPADAKQKIFSKKAATPQSLPLPVKQERGASAEGRKSPVPRQLEKRLRASDGVSAELIAQREADRISVNRFAPPGVLINNDLQILQFRGPTSAYLEPPTGKATFDVLKMARDGLIIPLRAAINKARKQNKGVRKENVQVQVHGSTRTVHLEVIPLKNLRQRCFLVLFEEPGNEGKMGPPPEAPRTGPVSRANRRREESQVATLKGELAETRDYLQSIQDQHESANEELQTSSEEVQSANEELQSINEELETSKEELESTNEELITVNEEMASRNGELIRVNTDLTNLQASTKLPIIVVARDLTIRRFSGPAEKLFNLLPTDLGRPLRGVRHNLDITDLDELLEEIIATGREESRDACDKAGRWYSLRVRPYLTLDNKIDGAVLVLVDITELKRIEQTVKADRDYAEATVRTARDPLLVLRADLHVNTANEAFYKLFKTTPAETEGRCIYDLGNGQWKIPRLRMLLDDILPRNSFFNDFEVTHEFPGIGRRTMLLNARRLDWETSAGEMILLAIEDVTERQRAEAAVAWLAAIVNFSGDAIIGEDLNGVITSWNKGAEGLFAYTAQEAVGQPMALLLPPDRLDEGREILDRIRRGESQTNFETVRLAKGGGRLHVSLTLSPIRDAGGRVIGAANVARDITDRIGADEARRKLAEQLAEELAAARRLQETSTLLIQGGDIKSLYERIIEAGMAIMNSDMASLQMLDPERSELQLLAWRGFHPESAAFWQWVKPDAQNCCGVNLNNPQRIIIPDTEVSGRARNGADLEEYRRSRIRAVQSTPLVTRAGRLIGVISTHWRRPHEPGDRELRLFDVLARQAADLIERMQAEEALWQAQAQLADRAGQLERAVTQRTSELAATNHQLEAVVYSIAHDLRAPLRSMQGFASILVEEEGPRLTEMGRDYADRISRSAQFMDALLLDLLSFSRVSQQPMGLESVALEGAVTSVLARLETAIHDSQGRVEPLGPWPQVLAHEPTLELVLFNLISNALKFCKPGVSPLVQLRAEERDPFVRVWVEDNGIGIAPAYQEEIFQLFTRLHGPKFPGTGIGLAIAHKGVERMGGRMGVQSGLDQGSRFWFELRKGNILPAT